QESRLPPGSDFRRWVWITIAPFVTPGESKELQLDLGLGDSRSFPIFPAVSGLTGRSEFMINIEELK
ncbi:hypothetical protein MRY58_25230, partial [Escherichia coli]|nr:hypothetical protein [Escherichia coli]